ncbi:MAG: hypothetical protein JWO74_609 [Solirubrobacterales bacterium]|jgi:hypothetical protein|nr:hypothetical protein [Solirubrobacterales bacterium]
MSDSRLRSGHLVALAGAAITAVALWLPWYALTLPRQFRQAIADGAVPGTLGQLTREVVAMLPEHMDATGWQALDGIDVALLVIAVLVAGVVLLAAGAGAPGAQVDAAGAARVASVAGAVATGFVLLKLVDPPGPNEIMSVRYGAWAALAGGVLMLAGGRMASGAVARPTPISPFAASYTPHSGTAPSDFAGGSIAPPSARR